MAVDNKGPHILLLGGGYTLQEVARRLPAHSFVITSRDATRVEEFRKLGWCSAVVDNANEQSLGRVFSEFPTISHVVDSVPPLQGADPSIGARVCASFFGSAAVQRVIYLSTTGVFGVRDGSWVDESTPEQPWSPPGRARLECELAYRNAGLTVTSLRLPAIYGPGRGTELSIKSGRYRLVEDGSNWTNRIHVEDLAAVIIAALKAERLPPTLCVSDDEPAQAKVVVEYFCQKFSLPLPPSVSRDDLLQQGAFTLLSNQRVRNARMKEYLGVSLRYPNFRSAA